MKRFFLAAIFALTAVVSFMAIQPDVRAEGTPAYFDALFTAYDFYQAGEYEDALTGYEFAAKLAAKGSAEWSDAEIGVQNCLIALARYDEAAFVGRRLIRGGGASVFVFLNTGFANLESGHYKDALENYRGVHVLEPGNIAAIQGIAWSCYRLDDRLAARNYVNKGLRIDPGNASLLELERRLYQNAWTYYLGGYLTYLNYSSPVKDNGNARQVFFSATYRNIHTFELALAGLSLDFVGPSLADLNERSTLIGYHWSGPIMTSVLYGNISSGDQTLGKGEYLFGKIEKGSWFAQAGATSYQRAAASQGGVGYRWYRGRYSLSSVAEILSRKEIIGIAPRKGYAVFSQKHGWDFAPWTLSLNYTLGKSSLLLREHGYVAYNAPEEIDFIGGAGVEFARDWGTIGYQLGYASGTHLADPAKRDYHAMTHTLSYSQRW